jgi:hypothetical protein
MPVVRRAAALVVAGLAACGLTACASGPDPDTGTWQAWIADTDPTTATGGSIAGLAGAGGEHAGGRLGMSDHPEAISAIELGCTGTGTMAFSITLTAASGSGERSDTFLHDIVCSGRMATPLAPPAGFETVTGMTVAVSSSDDRGAWRVILDVDG